MSETDGVWAFVYVYLVFVVVYKGDDGNLFCVLGKLKYVIHKCLQSMVVYVSLTPHSSKNYGRFSSL